MHRFAYVTMLVVFTALSISAFGGTLDSPGGPATTAGHMPTLEELYDYLTTGAAPGAAEAFQEPSSGPTGGTMHTLQQIYDGIKALLDQITATAADVRSGTQYFSTSPWGIQSGAMPTQTLSATSTTVDAGYYTATDLVTIDSDLIAANIKCGVTLFGIEGTGDLPECVARTGQTGCWDVGGTSIPCTGTGQDGEYQMGCPPSVSPSSGSNFGGYNRTSFTCTTGFTDNGDGTVTDNLSGLIWLKNADCFGTRSWTQALSDANTLSAGSCGLSDGSAAGDWRLPNLNELRSLFDPGLSAPYLPAGHPFTGVQSNFYWSSTARGTYPYFAWSVYLSNGYVIARSKSSTFYVWPVR